MGLTKPEGSECGLTYSTDLKVQPGHYIIPLQLGEHGHYILALHRTAYRVQDVRLVSQRKPDPKWPFKYALRVLRCKPENIPTDAVKHPMFWSNRNKKRGRGE